MAVKRWEHEAVADAMQARLKHDTAMMRVIGSKLITEVYMSKQLLLVENPCDKAGRLSAWLSGSIHTEGNLFILQIGYLRRETVSKLLRFCAA